MTTKSPQTQPPRSQGRDLGHPFIFGWSDMGHPPVGQAGAGGGDVALAVGHDPARAQPVGEVVVERGGVLALVSGSRLGL